MKNCSTHCCLGEHKLKQAVNVLASGGIVAFPTETYYGLAVDPFNEKALEKLFKIKKRSRKKPILVLIDNVEQLPILVESIPEPYFPLIKRYWPGPLTLIFKANKQVNTLLTGDSGSVGIRISPHPVALELCKAWKNPLTATSANISGMNPAKNSKEVLEYFRKDIDFVVDGGAAPAELCSTIVGCRDSELILVRKGMIDFQRLRTGN